MLLNVGFQLAASLWGNKVISLLGLVIEFINYEHSVNSFLHQLHGMSSLLKSTHFFGIGRNTLQQMNSYIPCFYSVQ